MYLPGLLIGQLSLHSKTIFPSHFTKNLPFSNHWLRHLRTYQFFILCFSVHRLYAFIAFISLFSNPTIYRKFDKEAEWDPSRLAATTLKRKKKNMSNL